LRNPNFRVYFAAQIGSNIGSWIQITTENWLVLQLTDSGLALGITNAFQFGLLVFFGLYGGVIADRFDRRRLLIVTQSALAISQMPWSESPHLWHHASAPNAVTISGGAGRPARFPL
jgi:MFS family permease